MYKRTGCDRERVTLENITEGCRKARLRWFGHVKRIDQHTSEQTFWRCIIVWYRLGEEEDDQSRDEYYVSNGT